MLNNSLIFLSSFGSKSKLFLLFALLGSSSIVIGQGGGSTTTFNYSNSMGTVGTSFTSSPLTPPNTATYYEVSNMYSSLPSGLSISTSTGSITGTPTAISMAYVTINAYSSSITSTANLVGTANISFSITSGSSSSTTTFTYNNTSGTVGTSFTSSPLTPPNTATYYEVSNMYSSLPSGLSISTSTGSITGTPTAISMAYVTINAYSSSITSTANLVGTANITFNITSGSSSSTTTFNYNSNNGFIGYSFSSNPSISPVFANSFVLTSGTLPSGLTFNPSDGLISGTPTAVNSSTITITGYNGATLYGTATITFNIVRKTYYSISNGPWSTSLTWSLSSGGVAEQSGQPGVSDNVVIERNKSVTIGLSSNTSANNVIIKDGSTLSVTGNINAASGVTVNPGGTLVGSSVNVTGNVSLQQSVVGQRGWRLFANPFATSQVSLANTGMYASSSTLNDVKIWSNASNSWSSAGSSFSNLTISANTAYAAFIRGSSSDNINGLTYTSGPSAFVYNVSGTLNPSTISITPASSSNFIIVGNPYAAPVNTQALTGGVSLPYYIYKVSSTGVPTNTPTVKSGSWTAVVGSNLTTTIPVLGVLCFVPSSTSTFNITTSDINETGSVQTGLFSSEGSLQLIEITLNNNQGFIDKLFIRSDINATNKGNDRLDLPKFQNETYNFYTISPDKTQLAVDARKEWNQIVPLGIKTPAGNYSIRIDNNTLSVGKSIYLKDNYLNKSTLIKTGTVYNFTVSNDSLSQGDKRFELQFGLASNTLPIDESLNGGLKLKVIGTVLKGNLLTIEVGGLKANEVGQVILLDMNGRMLKSKTVVNGVNKLSINELSNGLQLIKLSNGKDQLVKKFIKD